MDNFLNSLKNFFSTFDWEPVTRNGLRVVVILFAAWITSRIARSFLKEMQKRLIKQGIVEGEPPTESQKRVETIVRLLRQGVLMAIWITALLMILNQIGVQIGPIIASAGIVGLAVGFGAQNLVRDVISGFFIIMENQIRVGDVAVINGTGGLVDKIKFRTTVLRDLSGVVHVFPNGTITTLSNLTNDWSAYVFDIGVAYKEDTDRVMEVMKEVGAEMKADERLGKLMLEEPEIFGVDKFGDSAVVIKGRIKTRPIRQWEVGRQYLRRIKYAFDANDIEIPFPHTSLYVGEASKPLEVSLMERLSGSQNHQDSPETG